MKQITEDYVSYETAKLLKEKGVDFIDCVTYYCEGRPKEVDYSFLEETNSTWEERCCQAPTHQMTLKWLREVHNIYIDILTYITGKNIQFRWVGYNKGRLFSQEEGKIIYFNSYEGAVEAALKYTLENLI